MGKEKRAAIYLRVSTGEQTVDNQRRELEAAGRVYCGQRCALSSRARLISSTGSQRKLKGADVLQAIELRTGGMTWKAVGQLYAAGPQAVQRAVWVHLAKTGRLTETVE